MRASPSGDGAKTHRQGRAAETPRGSEARQRLVDAALEHFSAHGIGDASLREIAAGIGTSHRMIIYHFGSRAELLTAVVAELDRREQQLLLDMMADTETDGRVLAWRFWTHVADVGDRYGPLFYELASRAMRSADPNDALRRPNVEMWTTALQKMWERDGRFSGREAAAHARLNLGVARGLLHDLLLTRDRAGVDAAMAHFDQLSHGSPHPLPAVAALANPRGRPNRARKRGV